MIALALAARLVLVGAPSHNIDELFLAVPPALLKDLSCDDLSDPEARRQALAAEPSKTVVDRPNGYLEFPWCNSATCSKLEVALFVEADGTPLVAVAYGEGQGARFFHVDAHGEWEETYPLPAEVSEGQFPWSINTHKLKKSDLMLFHVELPRTGTTVRVVGQIIRLPEHIDDSGPGQGGETHLDSATLNFAWNKRKGSFERERPAQSPAGHGRY